ncbi:MAG: DUF4241 domain-containing protein [Actinomycetaceae bacterium]|nr:DUF4241 domain-containing protein [Actinomycetaceae bacterium]
MAIDTFYALVEGTIPTPPQAKALYPQDTLALSVIDLGTLTITSGFVLAGDPLVHLEAGPQFPLPPGEYPVKVTVADLSAQQDGSNIKHIYLSLLLGQGEPAIKEPIASTNSEPNNDGYHCFFGDTDQVAFVDPTHLARYAHLPEDGNAWVDMVSNNWNQFIEAPHCYPKGMANIAFPGAENGENIVIATTSGHDCVFPVALTRDSQGQALGLHIDMKAWD